MPSNLPPGVTDAMIPGNTAADAKYEWLTQRLSLVLGNDADKISDEAFELLALFVQEHAEGSYDQGFRDGVRDEQCSSREAAEARGE